jgi:hypothetical protein
MNTSEELNESLVLNLQSRVIELVSSILFKVSNMPKKELSGKGGDEFIVSQKVCLQVN